MLFTNRLHIFLSFALVAAVGVFAQTPSLDKCLLDCVTQATANSTCTSFTDITCVCSSSSFQSTAAACLQANCTTQDQDTAIQLRNQQCGTSSAIPTGTGTSATSANATSKAASPTSSKSSAVPIVAEQLPFLTAVVAIAGVALGGAFAL